MKWDDLNYWRSGEWQVVEERLDDLDKVGKLYNPARHLLFAALDAVPIEKVKCVIMGQDPYPNSGFATGFAFSIPKGSIWDWPPTLTNILKEYSDDLHLPMPKSGNLDKWVDEGVLLWNAVPTCEAGVSLSHDWTEWSYLTTEIITTLSNRGDCTFVLVGAVARRYNKLIDTSRNGLFETGHPSPRGNISSKKPFNGSRIFSTVNAYRVQCLRLHPIDWNLEDFSSGQRQCLEETAERAGITRVLKSSPSLVDVSKDIIKPVVKSIDSLTKSK